MVVVRAAVERDVAVGRGLAAVGVVGDLIGAQNVVAVVNLGVAVQLVDVAVFFLGDGADGGLVASLRWRPAGAGRIQRRGFLLGLCAGESTDWPEFSASNWLVTSDEAGSW